MIRLTDEELSPIRQKASAVLPPLTEAHLKRPSASREFPPQKETSWALQVSQGTATHAWCKTRRKKAHAIATGSTYVIIREKARSRPGDSK
jgi:hypothetical protein